MNHIRVTHEIQKEIGGRRLTKSPRYVFSDIIYNLYVIWITFLHKLGIFS